MRRLPSGRRRTRSLDTLIDTVAVDASGRSVAVLDRWHSLNDLDDDIAAVLIRELRSSAVETRLQQLLRPEDIDVLYLRLVAGWSLADVAREQCCHRSTIQRREDRALRQLRRDAGLQQLAGIAQTVQQAACNTAHLLMEALGDAAAAQPHDNGQAPVRKRPHRCPSLSI
jgi:hypothetical protein